MSAFESWGRYPSGTKAAVYLNWRQENLPAQKNILPVGSGKSYGDACLNEGGQVISTKYLNHFIAFDATKGIITCEAGVTLAQVLQLAVPHGWFLLVTPGIKYITVGGAISNDVHGKNHHRAGNFAHHLLQFELLRSSGQRLICSPTENKELFQATIGGIGLTGLITWAQFSLKPISSVFIEAQQIVTKNFSECLSVMSESKETYEYVIASLDSSASGKSMGSGAVLRGNHSTQKDVTGSETVSAPLFSLPSPLPISAVNRFTTGIFNKLYYHKQLTKQKNWRVHYNPFFYPQDILGNWNYLYGPKGFLQYQCQLPNEGALGTLEEIFHTMQKNGFASPLTTLKILGEKKSLGLLSFPKPGYTLALDFPNTGKNLLDMFEKLDIIVQKNHGRLYLAKDARMSSDFFKNSYPNWQEFSRHIDPAFSSSMWRRLSL